MLISSFFVLQHPRAEEGEEPGCCEVEEGEGEFRVLRIGENAPASGCHNVAVGQGEHYSFDDLVFETQGFQRAR